MKILIAYASKKGATQDMAARIARGLGNADLVDMCNARAGAVDLSGYGLVVIGSPSYIGALHKDATTWIKARAAELSGKKLAFFELGSAMNELAIKTTFPSLYSGAIAATKLGGEIRWNKLSSLEKLAVKAIMKTSGDSSTIDQHAVDDFIATLAALA